jgi:hypothetical protein
MTSTAVPPEVPPAPLSKWASVKDHPLIVVIGFCAATAAGTWALAERVYDARNGGSDDPASTVTLREQAIADRDAEIARLKQQLADAGSGKDSGSSVPDPDAPVITKAYVTPRRDQEQLKVDQAIEFRDPNGDAAFINFIVLRTSASSIEARSVSIAQPPEEQVKGAVHRGTWNCSGGSYSVAFRVVITDTRGHASAPREYEIVCD